MALTNPSSWSSASTTGSPSNCDPSLIRSTTSVTHASGPTVATSVVMYSSTRTSSNSISVRFASSSLPSDIVHLPSAGCSAVLDHETSYPLRALKSEPNPVYSHDRLVSTVLD